MDPADDTIKHLFRYGPPVAISLMLALSLPTFAIATLVYVRILRDRTFSASGTIRLIVYCGFIDMFALLMNLVTVQLTGLSFAVSFFKILIEMKLSSMAIGVVHFAQGMQLHGLFTIAFNRAVILSRPALTKARRALLFRVSVLMLFLLPFLFCFPFGFLTTEYACRVSPNGDFLCGPRKATDVDPVISKFLEMLELAFLVGLNIITLLLNLYLLMISGREQRFVQDGNAGKVKTNFEHGIIVMSIASFAAQLCYLATQILSRSKPFSFTWQIANIFIGSPLTYTLACVTPFWFLILFSHSIRNAFFRVRVREKRCGSSFNSAVVSISLSPPEK